MTRRSDEGTHVAQGSDFLTMQREEGPEVKSFSDADTGVKPLVAFEAPPASTAPPLTWGSTNS